MLTALKITELHKQYGDLTALNRVTLDIQQGEFFGLLGPNGAGKSTLISIVAGLVRATDGAASILGHDVVADYRMARRNLGVVPQELVYDPFFTVQEMLRLQSGYFGLGRENSAWIDELLEGLGLSGKADATLRALSGGMKRRMLIAQALVHKPPVLVLDEPTAGVDVELRRSLWAFTKRLHDDGHTIVLTTHYLEEAEALCDRIAVLNLGELKAVDEKRALLERHPWRLLSLTLKGDAGLPAHLAAKQIEDREHPERVTLKLDRRQDNVGEVLDAIRTAGLTLVDIRTREPNLEEVFMELIDE